MSASAIDRSLTDGGESITDEEPGCRFDHHPGRWLRKLDGKSFFSILRTRHLVNSNRLGIECVWVRSSGENGSSPRSRWAHERSLRPWFRCAARFPRTQGSGP